MAAERHFDAALAANDRMGLRPWHAYTQVGSSTGYRTAARARAR